MGRKSASAGLLFCLVLTSIFLFFFFQSKKDRLLKVIFLNVGQGDSIYIEAPNRRQILIDAGPDRGVLPELGAVMPFWDRSLDMIIATHPDKDHIGGILDIVPRYAVSYYLEPAISADTDLYDELHKRIKEYNIPVHYPLRGTRIILDHEKGIVLDLLAPDETTLLHSDRNESSIVAILTYGQTSFLLTGDAGIPFENHLMKTLDPQFLDADILKLGHHGSRSSSSLEFLSVVTPELAIISAGKENRYGHPHADVLDNLNKLAVPYLGTYDSGRIKFQSDGESITITPQYKLGNFLF